MGTRTQVAVPLRPRRMHGGGNLPNEVDSFVGREAELERLRELHADTRLLTLVGPGGVGKTRLALRLLAVVRDSFPDGTWLADLGPVRDATLLPQALGVVFGVRQQPGLPWLDELTRTLRAHRLVLMLDNCEHLVEPCCEIVEGLLRACPDLTVITTSQQPLGATGELTWRVPPLSLPIASATLPHELEASEAVRLLLARIRSRMPDFQLTDGNAAHIGEICRRLDGLPLALELVAARVESLGVVEVATRLSDRFTLVVGSSRTVPARQQALQATLEWSCSLLDEDELTLLRRLAVFVGGWTLAAAEATCAGTPLTQERIFEVLGRLVTKSLVVVDHSGAEVRYRLLETIRAYAVRLLATSGELETVQRQHAAFMLALADRAAPESQDSAQAAVLKPEVDNLRAALEWAVQHDVELGLRLATACFVLWWFLGHYAEGAAWVDRLLAQPAASGVPLIRALALAFNGQLRLMLGDYAIAEAHGEAALAELRSRGDARGIALALEILANTALQRGDLNRARDLHAESVERKREFGGPFTANNLMQLGLIAFELGDIDGVRDLSAELDRSGEARHEPVVVSWALCLRALAVRAAGDVGAAADLLEQALTLHRQAGDQQSAVRTLTSLGHMRLDEGEHAASLVAFAEAVHLARASGERIRVIRALEGCARWLATRDADAALRIAGALDRQRQLLGAVPWPSERQHMDGWLTLARGVLGESSSERAWDDGHASTLVQALALTEALMVEPDVAAASPSPLTPRELEVAALLAQGLTNKQIAQRLVVSPATVRSHVEHVLTKLDLRSRAQIAVWAAQQGLLEETT